MKERQRNDTLPPSLEVFPYLNEDATAKEMAFNGCVQAFYHEDEWRIRINMTMREGLNKEESDKLIAAINRCWVWIGEQSK